MRIKILSYVSGQRIRYKKSLVEALNRYEQETMGSWYEKQEVVGKKNVSLLENEFKILDSRTGLTRQVSGNKPNTKLVLLCL